MEEVIGMTQEPSRADEIADAVEICLGLAAGHNSPFKRVSNYLASLRQSEGWTDAEIMAVQMRVIRALMKRDGADE
jgi:hypothetical protein